MMSGQQCFPFLSPLHFITIILLFSHLTLSGAVEPHRPPAMKPPKAPLNSPSNTHTPPAHHPPADDIENQLPYFFILQLPNMLSDEPTWSEWSAWSACGVSCGATSRQVRRRHCQQGLEGACPGDSTQWRTCKTAPCPKENPLHQVGQAGTPRGATGHMPKGDGKFPVQEVAKEFGKLDRGKMGLNGLVEHHKEDAQRKGVVDENKPEVEGEEEQQPSSGSVTDRLEWHECLSPCPYKIQLRRRWCYLGQYCVGATREIRVCACGQGDLVSCGTVNTTDILEFSDTNNHSTPWTDTHIGWSLWTPWASCSSECNFHVEVVNRSRLCLDACGQEILTICHSQNDRVRVCREDPEASLTSPPVCGQVEHWKLDEDAAAKRRSFFPSSSRLIHAIVIFVLFAPPIILLFYWLLSRAHKPRYESLPSASSAGESAVDANGQPSISADVTSALGPNHVTVETNPNAWKTV